MNEEQALFFSVFVLVMIIIFVIGAIAFIGKE